MIEYMFDDILVNDTIHLTTKIAMAKITTVKQFELLVSFMEEHSALAKGYNATADARSSSKTLWSEISNRLNSHGPPIRSPDLWKKVWADFKFHIKRRLKLNKISISQTGGGQSKIFTFSPLEEAVIRLIDLNRAIEGTAGTRDHGDSNLNLPIINIDSPPTLSIDNNMQDENIDVIVRNIEAPTPRTVRKSKENLLEAHTKVQEAFHLNISNKLESLTNTVADSSESLKRLVRLEEKSIELRKREIELKEREIELKEKEIKLRERSSLDKHKLKLEDLELKRRKLEI